MIVVLSYEVLTMQHYYTTWYRYRLSNYCRCELFFRRLSAKVLPAACDANHYRTWVGTCSTWAGTLPTQDTDLKVPQADRLMEALYVGRRQEARGSLIMSALAMTSREPAEPRNQLSQFRCPLQRIGGYTLVPEFMILGLMCMWSCS